MQTEMMPVLESVNAANELRRLEQERLTQLHLDTWGKVGLLTLDDIGRSTRPNWQWDDYSI
jgi:hypothetical protein